MDNLTLVSSLTARRYRAAARDRRAFSVHSFRIEIPKSVASVGLGARGAGSSNDLRLIGQPLPRLGHFDEKGLVSRIGSVACFYEATRRVPLIQFCNLHGRFTI
jgi:hypothetical protein